MSNQTQRVVLVGISGAARIKLVDLVHDLGRKVDTHDGSIDQAALCLFGPELFAEYAADPNHQRWNGPTVVLASDKALEDADCRAWPEHWRWAPWPLNSKRLDHTLSLAERAKTREQLNGSEQDWQAVGQQLLQTLRAAEMFEFEYDLRNGERRTNLREQFGEVESPTNIEQMLQLVIPEDRPVVLDAYRRSRDLGDEFRVLMRIQVGAGEVRWARSIGKVYDRTQTHPGRLVGVSWDAHEEHQAKQAAVVAQQRLSETLAVGGMYSWEWNCVGGNRVLSDELPGDLVSQLHSHDLDELIDPADRDSDLLRFRTAVERGERYRSEVKLNFSARDQRQMMLWGSPVTDAGGATIGMRGVALDMTEQHALLEELASARSLLVDSVHAGQMYCWEWNLRDGSARTLGPAEEILGVSPVNPAHMQAIVHPQDSNRNCGLLMAALRDGTPFRNEFRVVRPNGEIRWISTRASPVLNEDGRLMRLIGISIDTTDRRQATNELGLAQQRLSVALEAAKLNPWSINLRTGAIEPGPRDFELFGRALTSHEVFSSLVVAEDRATADRLQSPEFLRSGEPLHVEFRVQREDGEMRWISSYAMSVLGNDGEPESLAGVSQDISEARHVQEQLAQTLVQLDRVQSATNVVLWEWTRGEGVACYATGGMTLRGAEVPQIHSEDRWRVARRILQCSVSDAVLDEEVRVDNRNGIYLWVNLQGRRTEFRGDGSAVVSGVMIDISARKDDRERARKAEERLRRALEAANMRCWDWQTDLLAADCDPLASYTPTVFHSERTAPSRVHPDDQERHRQSIADALHGKADSYRCEFRVLLPDSKIIWLLSIGRQIVDPESGRLSLTGVAIDISAQKVLESRLQESQQWQRIAVEAAQLNLTRVDTVTHERSGGELDHLLFGYSPGVYDDFAQLIHPDDFSHARRAWDNCVDNGVDYNIDYRVQPKGGPLRHLRVRAKRIVDVATGHPMVVGATRDVTEEIHAERDLQQALATAREASAAKSAFLASVSHELRTPLNAVVGYANLLDEDGPKEVRRRQLGVLKTSAGQLMDLVNDVLDISRIEAGEMILETLPFSLHECLESSLDVVAAVAEEKSLCLLMTSNGIQQPQVIGDPTRLRQVLVNLLSNAVKFTAEGEVTVDLCSVQVGDQINILCRVVDSGIGMTEEVLGGLFVPFRQGDVSTTRRYGGTGLGLSICRHIVGAMNGQLHCQSESGKGTAFEIVLSLPVAQGNYASSLDAMRELRIGVIVNSAAMRRALRYQLDQFGAIVVELTPADCVRALERPSTQFDALVVGAPILKQLVKCVAWPQSSSGWPTGVVVLSGTSGLTAPWTGLHQESYVPISRALQPRALAGALQQLQNLTMSSAQSISSARESVSRAATDGLSQLRVLVVEDNEINRTLLEIQIQSLGAQPVCADSGSRALELVAEADFDVVLMDIEMPGMDGLQTAARIRSDMAADRPRPYIVAVTAHVLSGVRERITAAGMDDFVAKPVDIENIRTVLLRARECWLG